jgi:hypothetical protein
MVAVIRDALIAAIGEKVTFETIEAHRTFLRVRLRHCAALEPIGVAALTLTIFFSVVLPDSFT